MTRTELFERQQAYRRTLGKAVPFFFFPMITFFGTISYHGIHIGRGSYWPEVAAFVALAALLAATAIVAPRLKDRQLRKMGLVCPSCGEALVNTTGQIAAVTGRCGNCGHRVTEPG